MKHPFWWKALWFISLSYGVIPLFFSLFTPPEAYNFFALPAFSLIAIILFGIFHRQHFITAKSPPLTQKMIYGALTIACFLFYYYLRFLVTPTMYSFAWILLASGVLYLLGIFFIALIFFGATPFLKNYPSLLVFGIVGYIFYIITQSLWKIGALILPLVTRSVVFILRQIYGHNNVVLLPTVPDPSLSIKNFGVIVGAPCSGIESLAMFSALFLLLMVYEHKQLHPQRAAVVFLIGLVGTFLLNLLRITLIMITGTYYPELAIGLFHSQVGWILFSLFMLLLIYLAYPWMRKGQTR